MSLCRTTFGEVVLCFFGSISDPLLRIDRREDCVTYHLQLAFSGSLFSPHTAHTQDTARHKQTQSPNVRSRTTIASATAAYRARSGQHSRDHDNNLNKDILALSVCTSSIDFVALLGMSDR